MKKELYSINTRYGSHFCIFDPDDDKGGYVVIAKHVPGVVTWGRNLIHAKKMAKEALELSIESIALEEPFSVSVRSGRNTLS